MKRLLGAAWVVCVVACGGGGSSAPADAGVLTCAEWCASAVPGMCAGVSEMDRCLAGCTSASSVCSTQMSTFLQCVGLTTSVCGRCTAEQQAVSDCFRDACAANPSMSGC